jgi:quinol monooxygenase YgiN
MPVLVATIIPNPGQLDAVVEAIRDLVPAVHDEDGCELYALHKGKDRVVFVEKWRDMAALGAHGQSDNIKALGERLAGLTSERVDVQVLEAIPIGGSQGQVGPAAG